MGKSLWRKTICMFMAFVVAVSSFGVDVFRNEVRAECGPRKMWQMDE